VLLDDKGSFKHRATAIGVESVIERLVVIATEGSNETKDRPAEKI
jgi:hypothetical protein